MYARFLFVSVIYLFFIPFAHAQVVISEVHWVGSDLSTADEWLELSALRATNLEGWKITSQNSKGEEKEIVTFENTSISQGEFFIISNYGVGESRLLSHPDVVTSAVSLPNSKLLLRLYNASGALVDEVDDGVGEPFAGGKSDNGMEYMSMERIDFSASGRDKSNWRTATTVQGLPAEGPVFGTPGYENGSGDASSFSSSSSSSSSSYFFSSSLSSASSSISLPSIFINEVLADPKGKDDHEWIELVNKGETSVLLNDWKLSVGSQEFIFPKTDLLLVPEEFISLRKSFTGLSLTNKGDLIQLWSGSYLIDEMEYATAQTGVSYGKYEGDLLPFCMSSEGKPNKKIAQQIIINIQSGKTKGEEKVTLNLEAKALNGSIDLVDCYWEYSDGFRSTTCNPPSHTFENEGVFSVELRAKNICGDSVVEVLHGMVYPKKREEEKNEYEKLEEKIIKEEMVSDEKPQSSYSSYSSDSSYSSHSSSSSINRNQTKVLGLTTDYEHVIPGISSAKSSKLLEMFQEQIVDVERKKEQIAPKTWFPVELVFFAIVVLPGWWFLRTGFYNGASRKR